MRATRLSLRAAIEAGRAPFTGVLMPLGVERGGKMIKINTSPDCD
jgi:hypothetical protein